jgi:hypothetical protein
VKNSTNSSNNTPPSGSDKENDLFRRLAKVQTPLSPDSNSSIASGPSFAPKGKELTALDEDLIERVMKQHPGLTRDEAIEALEDAGAF